MRTRILSKAMRKWVVGGCLFFGGSAVLTTGFATWIIGTQITSANNQPTITVDTAVNDSVSIETTLGSNNSIHLSENIAEDPSNTSQIVFTENGSEADFTIEFSEIVINCGKSYWERNFALKNSEGVYEEIDFQLKLAFNYDYQLKDNEVGVKDDLTKNNKVVTTGDHRGLYLENVNRKVLGTDEYYTYIDFANNKIDINAASDNSINWEEEKGYMELKMTNVTVNFTWGSFFHRYLNGSPIPTKYSPAEFYNQLSSEGLITSVGDIANVFNEFEAMTKAFTADEGLEPFINVSVSLPTNNE